MIDYGHRAGGMILASVFIATSLYMAHKTLNFIHRLPSTYFDMLPASSSTDFDRDGIPDYIDDSDGDGIADDKDPQPYGRGMSVLQHVRSRRLP